MPGYPARAFGPAMLMFARDPRDEVEIFSMALRARVVGQGAQSHEVTKSGPGERREHGAEYAEMNPVKLPVKRIKSFDSARETGRIYFDFRQGGVGDLILDVVEFLGTTDFVALGQCVHRHVTHIMLPSFLVRSYPFFQSFTLRVV